MSVSRSDSETKFPRPLFAPLRSGGEWCVEPVLRAEMSVDIGTRPECCLSLLKDIKISGTLRYPRLLGDHLLRSEFVKKSNQFSKTEVH